MLGITDSDDENEDSDEEPDSRRANKKKRLELSGDDLGENFVLDDEEQEGKGWVDEVMARNGDEEADSGEEGSGEEEGDSEEDDDEEDDEEEADDSADGDDSDEQFSDEDDLPNKQTSLKEFERPSAKAKKDLVMEEATAVKMLSSEAEELPFVISAPESLGEFRGLVDHRSTEDLGVAIQRIRTCNAISLAAENRKKMQVCLYFVGILMEPLLQRV
jgi:nucleolar protein 14